MFLKSTDIAYFLYCPHIKNKSGAQEVVLSRLTPFEEKIRSAIKDTERNCLYKNSEITPRKIIRSWDKIWWPYVAEQGIDLKHAESLSLKASVKFNDYCKYDISDYIYSCVGIDITSAKNIGSSTVESTVDLVKVDLSQNKRNIMLIDFGRKGMTSRDVALDADVMTKACCFYQGQRENITYINIDLGENRRKLHISMAVFRPDDIPKIRKMITMAKIGIENNVEYMNRWNCKECKLCQNFK